MHDSDWVLYNQQGSNQICSPKRSSKTRKFFLGARFQLSTANRKINTDGGDILGQVSQTNNRPGDINSVDLRLTAFTSNALKMDFEMTACTSMNARKHIHRAYYQMQLWVQAPFRDATLTMNAEINFMD